MNFKDRLLVSSQPSQVHRESATYDGRPAHYNAWDDTSMRKAMIAVEEGE